MSIQPVESKIVDRIHVYVFESNEKLGIRAADDLATLLSRIVGKQGRAAVILATGNSQLAFVDALRVKKNIAWDKVIVFHMDEYLDLPDVIALRAPSPLMVRFDRDDTLFTPEGEHEADRKIGEIYSKMGHPSNYRRKFYPGAHKFDALMQEEAFQWLEKCLMEDRSG